jgi:O-antigen/teichoic acid export membrane protein
MTALTLEPESTESIEPSEPARLSGRLLQKVAGYSAIRASAEALFGLRGILLAMLLGPAAFGSWALLRLSVRYAALAGGGVFRGLELELLAPKADAKVAPRSEAAGAALGFMLLVSGTLATAALVASAVVADPASGLTLQAFAAAVVAEAVYGYALVYTRVRTTLLRYAMLEAGTAALHLGLGVTLTWSFGLAGAFAALALASALGAAVAGSWIELRPVFRSAVLRRMLAVGFPVALTGAVGTLLGTADRLVVAVWGGQELLGYYAFAGARASVAAALALAIRTVVFPDVYGEAKAIGAATALQRHMERAMMPYAALVPPVLGAVGICLGLVVPVVLPGYADAVAPARLFLLAGAAVGLVNLAAIGAVAAGQQRALPMYAAAGLAINLILSVAVLLAGGGLEAVAAASLAGHVVFAAAVVGLNARVSKVRRPERFIRRALRSLIWAAIAVTVSGHAAAELGSEAAGIGIYLVLLAPLFPRMRSEWRRMHGYR